MNSVTKTLLIGLAIICTSCQTRELNTQTSYLTGWKTFDKSTNNFEAYAGSISQLPPGMVAIPGGSFTIGQTDEFITS